MGCGAQTGHGLGKSCPQPLWVRGLAGSSPHTHQGCWGARDERELQSRAATTKAALAIDQWAAWGACGRPSAPAPREDGQRATQSRVTSSLFHDSAKGSQGHPLHPASAVGIQGRSHSHLALNINAPACKRSGCSTRTCTGTSRSVRGRPGAPGFAWMCTETPSLPGCTRIYPRSCLVLPHAPFLWVCHTCTDCCIHASPHDSDRFGGLKPLVHFPVHT